MTPNDTPLSGEVLNPDDPGAYTTDRRMTDDGARRIRQLAEIAEAMAVAELLRRVTGKPTRVTIHELEDV